MSPRRFDFVVAGSGAGGAAAARRLADGGAGVLLVEKGGSAKPESDAIRAVRRYYMGGGVVAALGSALVPVPTGCTVGGTTTINSGTCLRTPKPILERWEKNSAGDFDAADFSARLDEAWQLLQVRPAPAGTMSRCSELFLRGLKTRAIAGGRRLDRCEDGCRGSGRCCFVCPAGAKMTAETAFLRGAPERLRLSTRTELVSFSPPKKTGEPVRLALRSNGSRGVSRIECGTLVLAAGSLNTPYFIRKFVPAARGAGDGLSLHPAAKIFARFPEPVRGWEGVPQGAGLLDPDDEALRYEGVYTPPEMAALTMPIEGRRLRGWMENYHRVATFGFMIRDEARGSIRYPLGPGNPLLRYSPTPRDISRMLKGMRFLAKTFLAAGAERIVIPLNRPANEFSRAEELDAEALARAHPRELYTMAFHPLGTCGMGRVVDWNLRAAPGVYVCDGSVVPESLGVNPQITIYALALRLAAHLLGTRRPASAQRR